MITTKIVYGIEYNVTAVKAMTKTEFVQSYKGKLGKHTEHIYYEITGKQMPTPKKGKK